MIRTTLDRPRRFWQKSKQQVSSGLGGAGFPTHVKLAPKDPAAIKYVIANGAECEPYITCDDQLMRNYADEIVGGSEDHASALPECRRRGADRREQTGSHRSRSESMRR